MRVKLTRESGLRAACDATEASIERLLFVSLTEAANANSCPVAAVACTPNAWGLPSSKLKVTRVCIAAAGPTLQVRRACT